MNWFNKVGVFYKLANKEYEQDYKNDLANIGPQVNDYVKFMDEWENSPLFKLEDIIDGLMTSIRTHAPSLYDRLGGWYRKSEHRLKEELVDKVVNIIIENYIRYTDTFTLKDYLDVIPYKHSVELGLGKVMAQKVVEEVLKMVDEYQSGNMDDQSQFNMIEQLKRLDREFGWLDRRVVDELIKKFGVDVYVKIRTHPISDVEYLQATELSVFSVARILEQNSYSGHSKLILLLIEKGDAEAREYLRSFVYNAGLSHKGGPGFFILDEQMTPIDEHYKEVKWPDYVALIKLSNLPDDRPFKQQWKKMLEEFNVIPA